MSQKFFVNDAAEIVPSVNDSPYKRILVVGDVHAAFDKLQSLWKKLAVTDDDLVIFLGDYLYGFTDKNVATLQWMIEQSKRPNIIFLRGNSDAAALDFLFDEDGKLVRGTDVAIVREIKTAAMTKPFLPREIYNFLNNLRLSCSIDVGDKKYFFCHAGIKVGVPLDRQTKTYLVDHPKYENFFSDYAGDAVIVVGHKRPRKIFDKCPKLFDDVAEKIDFTKPLKVPRKNILMLDTGAKANGPLSCVDILSGEVWQSDTVEVRDGILFVCAGNTCRSPMAKYIMRQLLREVGLDEKIAVDSAGCNTNGGKRLSKGAREALSEHGIPFDEHKSKPFTVREYRKFSRVVALDELVSLLAKMMTDGDPENKIETFSVDDPYDTRDYERAYEEIYGCCSTLLDEIKKASAKD